MEEEEAEEGWSMIAGIWGAKAKASVKFIKGDLPREPTRWLSTHEKHGDPDAIPNSLFRIKTRSQIHFDTRSSEFI